MIITILGPPNSGKSAMAERLCLRLARQRRVRPVYLATLADNDVHRDRLARHRARRTPHWHMRDLNVTPRQLSRVLRHQARLRSCVLLDGLGPLVYAQTTRFQLMPSELRALGQRVLTSIRMGARRGDWIVVDTPVERDLDTVLGGCLAQLHTQLALEGHLLHLERASL